MILCPFWVMSKDAEEPRGVGRGVLDPKRANQTKMPDTGY